MKPIFQMNDCKLPFHALSQGFLMREAHRHFVSEAVVFCLLMFTSTLPLVNGARAVAGLLRSAGGPFWPPQDCSGGRLPRHSNATAGIGRVIRCQAGSDKS